jgi:putative ABC transport system substrate-binding protein
MKNIKIILATVIVSLFALSCDHSNKVIAIVNLQPHPILDAIQNNVISTLKDSGFVDGENIRLIIKNANGQTGLIPSIANEVIAQRPDLVVTISTPITQQFVKNPKFPIVFGAVTDPVGSGVVKSLDQPEEEITGTADVLPYDEQIKLIRSIHPQLKRLGIIYNPAEPSSIFAMKHIDVDAPKYGFILVKKTVSQSAEIQQAALSLVSQCDVILVSSDNTVTGGIAAIVNVAIKYKKPLYAGDEGSIEKGAIASYSINYNQLGKETGKLCVRLLKGQKNIPVFVSKKGDLIINSKAASLMGVTLPDSIIKKAVKNYTSIN